MNVSDVMTHRVVTVGPAATVADAARLMLDHRISGLPVVDASVHVDMQGALPADLRFGLQIYSPSVAATRVHCSRSTGRQFCEGRPFAEACG